MSLATARAWVEGENTTAPPATPPHRFCLQPSGHSLSPAQTEPLGGDSLSLTAKLIQLRI